MEIIATRTHPDLLARLVHAAKNYKMTPAERFEQRVSFIWGQMADRAGSPSKEWVRQHMIDRDGYPSPSPAPRSDIIED